MSFTTLETTNFPLYAVNVLDKDHFLIAGGGGAAKTGVPNALVCIFALYLFTLIFYKYFIVHVVLLCLFIIFFLCLMFFFSWIRLHFIR